MHLEMYVRNMMSYCLLSFNKQIFYELLFLLRPVPVKNVFHIFNDDSTILPRVVFHQLESKIIIKI